MEILNKSDKKAVSEYESFVSNMKGASFMQSYNWARVKSNWSSEIVAVRGGDGNIVGSCLVLIKEIPFLKRSLLYAPRGPVCDYENQRVVEEIFEGIDRLADEYNAYKVICDPPLSENNNKGIELMRSMGFSRKGENSDNETVQCRCNYQLCIGGKSADEIMSGFKPDWRNRVRKASRKGVYCEAKGIEGLEDFYPMMEETGARDNFTVRSPEYFKRFMEGLGESCRLFICYADIEGNKTPLSGALSVKYSDTVTYVYGASSNKHRNLYPNYLMQWTMINWAIDNGCSLYDFGGIPCFQNENSPKYGIYKFKKGFGGETVCYAGDFVKEINPILCFFMQAYKEVRSLRNILLRESSKTPLSH